VPITFNKNPESLIRKARLHVDPLLASPPATEPVIKAPSVLNPMADKTLREYSVPAVANVPVGPTINMGDVNFELKTGLIMVVQASPFCRLPSEDPHKVTCI
jgi:hypothetical protein